jgi:hypothetical protein
VHTHQKTGNIEKFDGATFVFCNTLLEKLLFSEKTSVAMFGI